MKAERVLALGGVLIAVVATSACGSSDDADESGPPSLLSVATTLSVAATVPPVPSQVETTVSPVQSAAPLTAAPATEPPAPAAPAAAAVMPDVVCMNLQDAQDAIQEAGVFFSRSDDATGEGRMQLVDDNWQVVAQNPAPGTPIGELEAVLSVVEYGEASPC